MLVACQDCNAGECNPQTACTLCPPGTSQPSPNQSGCPPCQPGAISSSEVSYYAGYKMIFSYFYHFI